MRYIPCIIVLMYIGMLGCRNATAPENISVNIIGFESIPDFNDDINTYDIRYRLENGKNPVKSVSVRFKILRSDDLAQYATDERNITLNPGEMSDIVTFRVEIPGGMQMLSVSVDQIETK